MVVAVYGRGWSRFGVGVGSEWVVWLWRAMLLCVVVYERVVVSVTFHLNLVSTQ